MTISLIFLKLKRNVDATVIVFSYCLRHNVVDISVIFIRSFFNFSINVQDSEIQGANLFNLLGCSSLWSEEKFQFNIS